MSGHEAKSNPYQSPRPLMTRRQRAELTPLDPSTEDVIPRKDRRYGFTQRVGWWFMNSRVWPPAALDNAFFIYFLPKAGGGNIVRLLCWCLWIPLTALEIGASLLAPNHAGTLAGILVVEIYALPLMGGIAMSVCGLVEGQRLKNGGTLQEITLTRLLPHDIVYSLAARPLLRTIFGLVLNTAALAVVAHPLMLRIGGAGPIVLLIFLAGLIFRFFVTRAFADFGCACGLRAGLMMTQGGLVRALSDFFRRGFVYAISPLLVSLMLSPFAFICMPLAIVMPIGVVITMAVIASGAEKRATDVFLQIGRYLLRAPGGEEADFMSPIVPETLKRDWPVG
ncbi:hypothetical protein BH09SUM1_BH09SUM1_06910 [soil metagenome]